MAMYRDEFLLCSSETAARQSLCMTPYTHRDLALFGFSLCHTTGILEEEGQESIFRKQ